MNVRRSIAIALIQTPTERVRNPEEEYWTCTSYQFTDGFFIMVNPLWSTYNRFCNEPNNAKSIIIPAHRIAQITVRDCEA